MVVTDIEECISGLQENVAMNLPSPIIMRSTDITDQQRRQRTQAYDEHSPWSELSGLCVQDAMQPEVARRAVPSAPVSVGPGAPEEGGTQTVKDGQALADAARLRAMAWSDTVSDRVSDTVSDKVSGKVSDTESDTVASSMGRAPAAAGGGDSGLCGSLRATEAAVGGSGSGEMLWQGASQVTVAELDWRDDVSFLQPPFDVVLVADVVRVAPTIIIHGSISPEMNQRH